MHLAGRTQSALDAVAGDIRATGGRLYADVLDALDPGIPEADDPGAPGLADETLIGRAATHEDVGRVAVFAASDHARTMTAATLNIIGGAVID